jgi:membrane protease YdiL (CAAX protease family)
VIARILVFYLLAFFFTIVLGGLHQEILHLSPELSFLPQWGPGIAGLLMVWVFRKDGHTLNFSFWELTAKQIAKVFLLPLVPSALLLPVIWFTFPDFNLKLNLETPLILLLLNLAVGAVGEETGWRGYLHKRVSKACTPLVSIAIVSPLWLLWHVGLYQNGLLYMLAALFAFAGYTTVVYLMVRRLDFNIWVAAIFHFGVNIANLVFFTVINQTSFMALYSLAWAVMAIILYLRQNKIG